MGGVLGSVWERDVRLEEARMYLLLSTWMGRRVVVEVDCCGTIPTTANCVLNTPFRHHLMGDAGLTDPVDAVVDKDRRLADHVPDRLRAIEDVLVSVVSDIYTNDARTALTVTANERDAIFHHVDDEDVFQFTSRNGEKRAMQIMYETTITRL